MSANNKNVGRGWKSLRDWKDGFIAGLDHGYHYPYPEYLPKSGPFREGYNEGVYCWEHLNPLHGKGLWAHIKHWWNSRPYNKHY